MSTLWNWFSDCISRRNSHGLLAKFTGVALVLIGAFGGVRHFTFAQNGYNAPAWLPPTWQQARRISLLPKILSGGTPSSISQSVVLPDDTGKIASYQPGGSTSTSKNAFFQRIGSNGRTCFTCHQPQDGWSIKPSTIQSRFSNTHGLDPLFSPVDGADCPDVGAASTQPNQQFIQARNQLFSRANFRIFLPLPTNAQWVSLTVKSDPTGCENNSTYGMPAGYISVYRRPLPSANLAFLNPQGQGTPPQAIMWDGREPSLESQFVDASLVHAQATPAQLAALTGTSAGAAMIAQGVNFQQGMFVGQSYDLVAGDLTSGGANGGPKYLSTLSQLGNFSTMDLFNAYSTQSGQSSQKQMRQSIARGQDIFNNFNFTTSGVSGFNELPPIGDPDTTTQCATCHGNQDVGNDFFGGPKHTGIGDNSNLSFDQQTSTGLPAISPAPDLPLFVFLCPKESILFFSNPVTVNGTVYDKFETTDPGLGLITGQCSDLGKMKVPILRGLVSRAPYFHDGSAATLADVVNFYDTRFSIGLTDQQKKDLVNFLNSL